LRPIVLIFSSARTNQFRKQDVNRLTCAEDTVSPCGLKYIVQIWGIAPRDDIDSGICLFGRAADQQIVVVVYRQSEKRGVRSVFRKDRHCQNSAVQSGLFQFSARSGAP
jgi:hypothetical protein